MRPSDDEEDTGERVAGERATGYEDPGLFCGLPGEQQGSNPTAQMMALLSCIPRITQLLEKEDSSAALNARILALENAAKNSPAQSKQQKQLKEPDGNEEELWTKGNFDIEDNRSTQLDLSVRQSLGAINAPLSKWWGKLQQVSLPRRASSLHTSHTLGPSQLHPKVVWDLHDRGGFVEVKRLLKVNNGALRDPEPTLALADSSDGQFTTYIQNRNWKEPTTVQEIVEGVMMALGTVAQIRPQDPTWVAIMMAFTTCRWFWTVATSTKKQIEMVTGALQKCCNLNQSRARAGSPPLSYKEVMDEIKAVAAAAGLPEHRLQIGDLFSGTRPEEDKPSEQESMKSLRAEIESLKRERSQASQDQGMRLSKRQKTSGDFDRNANAQSRRGGWSTRTIRNKIAGACQMYNEETCPKQDGECSRAHKCTGIYGDGLLCYGNHPKRECRRDNTKQEHGE